MVVVTTPVTAVLVVLTVSRGPAGSRVGRLAPRVTRRILARRAIARLTRWVLAWRILTWRILTWYTGPAPSRQINIAATESFPPSCFNNDAFSDSVGYTLYNASMNRAVRVVKYNPGRRQGCAHAARREGDLEFRAAAVSMTGCSPLLTAGYRLLLLHHHARIFASHVLELYRRVVIENRSHRTCLMLRRITRLPTEACRQSARGSSTRAPSSPGSRYADRGRRSRLRRRACRPSLFELQPLGGPSSRIFSESRIIPQPDQTIIRPIRIDSTGSIFCHPV